MGPTAIADDACGLTRPRETGWRASLAGGLLSTRLDLGAPRVDLVQWSTVASAARRLSRKVTVQVGAGALLGGRLEVGERTFALDPGAVATAAATVLVADGRGAWPFVSATLALAHARTSTADGAPYRATDLSLSVAAGRSLGGWVAPYVGAKVFGGPVTWRLDGEALTGSDVHHYGLAIGAAFALPARFDLLVEGVPLGARGATLSLGRAF